MRVRSKISEVRWRHDFEAKAVMTGKVSPQGNYDIAFYARLTPGSLISARRIAPGIVERFHPTSVVDVGCASGAWLSAFRDLGVEDLLGVDGPHVDPASLLIPPASFRAADLTKPLDLQRTFDLALCLEVAEHLPAASAGVLVASLCSLAPVIVFSAAIPFQGGEGHVNEQWQDYWEALFKERGFVAVDCVRPHVWDDDAVETWYKQNTLVYVSAGRARSAESPVSLPCVRVVHPSTYMAWVTRQASLREAVSAVPRALRAALRHRVDRPRPRLN